MNRCLQIPVVCSLGLQLTIVVYPTVQHDTLYMSIEHVPNEFGKCMLLMRRLDDRSFRTTLFLLPFLK